MRYSEEEIAAEEEKLGAKLPDALRERYLKEVPESVLVRTDDGEDAEFAVWGPSTIDSDTKGREYPTAGMTQETQEVREMMGEFFPEEILVAWGADGTGDLVVVLKDGRSGGGDTTSRRRSSSGSTSTGPARRGPRAAAERPEIAFLDGSARSCVRGAESRRVRS
jgi:hypothetical protein